MYLIEVSCLDPLWIEESFLMKYFGISILGASVSGGLMFKFSGCLGICMY
jgi:hypothetical protein